MKYRSISLLLPMLVVSSYIGAADKAVCSKPENLAPEVLQRKIIAHNNQQFDDTPLPTWNKLLEQREQEWRDHDEAVSAMCEPKSVQHPSATVKQRIAPLSLREEINNLIPKQNRVEDISNFDGMTMPALTELVSQWESEEGEEKAPETFVVFGSEPNKDALMQERPMTAYHVKEIHGSEGCQYKIVSAETFEPGMKKSKPAKLHDLKNRKFKEPKLKKNNQFEIPSSASKPLTESKVGRKNKLDTPKSPEIFAQLLLDPTKEPKTYTQRLGDLKQEDTIFTGAVSGTMIGDNDQKKRKQIITQLRSELHKKVAALRFQHCGLAQARDALSNTSNMLAAQKTPDELAFYVHTLLQWHRDYQMTDEEKKQEMSDEQIKQIIRSLFTDEELTLAEKTITTKDTFSHSKIVDASNRGQEWEAIFVLDGNGTIPLARAVEAAGKTYDSWKWFKNWGMPQDASDLLSVAGELAQSRQQFAATKDANERAKLAEQQKELKEKQSELLKGIKAKMLTSIKENLPNYSPAPTEQKNNLEALIKSEDEAIVKNRGLVASALLQLATNKNEKESLFTTDKKIAFITKKRVDEIDDLLTNPRHYIIEEPKEKEEEEVKKAEPKEKETDASKAAQPRRRSMWQKQK